LAVRAERHRQVQGGLFGDGESESAVRGHRRLLRWLDAAAGLVLLEAFRIRGRDFPQDLNPNLEEPIDLFLIRLVSDESVSVDRNLVRFLVQGDVKEQRGLVRGAALEFLFQLEKIRFLDPGQEYAEVCI